MKAQILTLPEKYLVGMRIETSAANDKARELWQNFIPHLSHISNRVDTNFYSVQNYDKSMKFEDFTAQTIFEKWAAVEVPDLKTVPEGLEPYTLSGGKYAVFTHRGPASTFMKTWKSIFFEWLPASDYQLDNRAHFEILSQDYRPDDPQAREDVYIPIV